VGTVRTILRYPVKSMLGLGVEAAEVVGSGLVGDRRWALIDQQTGKVVSAKHPRWWRLLLTLGTEADGETGPVTVRLPDGSRLAAGDPGTDRALSALLGREVAMRQVRPAGAELDRAVPEAVLADGVDAAVPFELLELAQQTPGQTFVDYGPVHLISTATLAAIRGLGRHDADPARFRPNLVLDTPQRSGFAENEWVGSDLAIGDQVRLQVFLPTPRCAVPTLQHGELGPDPDLLRTLAAHNRIEVDGFGKQQCAGVYARVLTGGTIRTGDPIALLPPG
jgi:uncharacterized protein